MINQINKDAYSKKLSDFGFKIALNEYVGNRKNEFEDSRLFLENNMWTVMMENFLPKVFLCQKLRRLFD